MHEVRKLIDEEGVVMTALLLAEFADSERFVEAARRASGARLPPGRCLHAVSRRRHARAAGPRTSHIRVAMFIGGVAMAAFAYGLEYYSAVINYPYNSGGRPLDAWPAFMLVPFATGILVAAIAGFTTFLCRMRIAAPASSAVRGRRF